MTDIMDQQWACTACQKKFTFGEFKAQDIECMAGEVVSARCPKCGSHNISPADGSHRETEEYHGPIGTIQ